MDAGENGRKRPETDTTPEHPVKVPKLMQVPERTKGKYPVKMSCQVIHFKLRGSPKKKSRPVNATAGKFTNTGPINRILLTMLKLG